MARQTGNAAVRVVFGGDTYLNGRTVREWCDKALRQRPDAEFIELDAATADRYAFDEAVSPSLLADASVVRVDNLQSADEKLGDAIVDYCAHASSDPNPTGIVICRHEGGNKGKRLVERLVKAGARKEDVPDLKKPEAKLNMVYRWFEEQHRRIEPLAAQQLVDVLGERTGELNAMCRQLCFDFDDDPIGLERVNQYLTANPQVDGFAVADAAMAGRTADAIVMMRSAVEQGIEPIALIGALAMKLRSVAKVSAFNAGTISAAELGMSPWARKYVKLGGWTSTGMATCIRTLAWADEECKTNGGDPMYALERSIETIATKGRA
ncbi:DNA polymerase III subunit delta [Bifidobacterium saguinibicoloris]|uniref:DNA polymerase III subunit delta n=1 Tax=Bifidobacterium saguinibicoloris TaxID=2834433 RepID=UPI001C56888C|nr:DNA polymerase III subunit delta [Bifidobacterium saguinibicoloris]MBW3079829.1 DNA polymerase III subunit delta [Bifidobacterium saguinibicoloris]